MFLLEGSCKKKLEIIIGALVPRRVYGENSPFNINQLKVSPMDYAGCFKLLIFFFLNENKVLCSATPERKIKLW